MNFDGIPKLIAVIEEKIDNATLLDLKHNGVTVLELRIDILSKEVPNYREYLDEIIKFGYFDLIGTIRENDENIDNRIEMFNALIPKVHCIDIEFDCDILDEVIALIKKHDKTVMISHHDYDSTPSENELLNIIKTSKGKGADLIKIAVMANSDNDVKTLMKVTMDRQDDNLITISMGSIGKITRIIAPEFGSLMTYAYINKPVAPGQLSVSSLHEELRNHYSKYNEKYIIENEILECV